MFKTILGYIYRLPRKTIRDYMTIFPRTPIKTMKDYVIA